MGITACGVVSQPTERMAGQEPKIRIHMHDLTCSLTLGEGAILADMLAYRWMRCVSVLPMPQPTGLDFPPPERLIKTPASAIPSPQIAFGPSSNKTDSHDWERPLWRRIRITMPRRFAPQRCRPSNTKPASRFIRWVVPTMHRRADCIIRAWQDLSNRCSDFPWKYQMPLPLLRPRTSLAAVLLAIGIEAPARII